jgi:hypothetical protein
MWVHSSVSPEYEQLPIQDILPKYQTSRPVEQEIRSQNGSCTLRSACLMTHCLRDQQNSFLNISAQPSANAQRYRNEVLPSRNWWPSLSPLIPWKKYEKNRARHTIPNLLLK